MIFARLILIFLTTGGLSISSSVDIRTGFCSSFLSSSTSVTPSAAFATSVSPDGSCTAISDVRASVMPSSSSSSSSSRLSSNSSSSRTLSSNTDISISLDTFSFFVSSESRSRSLNIAFAAAASSLISSTSSSSSSSSSPNDTSSNSGRSSILVSDAAVSTEDCETDISEPISTKFSSTCIPADSISSVSCA